LSLAPSAVALAGSFGEEAGVTADADRTSPVLAGLSVAVEAVGVSWHGRRLNLSRAEARIVAHLLHRRRASWDELNRVLGRDGRRVATLRVFLYRLRQKLMAAGAPELMETIPGWGIALKDAPAPASLAF
jgi:DNA-binding response OmpR family regulator